MTERLHAWHYLCDTCRHEDTDGAGHFMCLDYVPPRYDSEMWVPLSEKLAIPDYKEPHEICLNWEAVEANCETNYERLFGTPEKAARVIMALRDCRVVDCIDCWARDVCRVYSEFELTGTLTEWLYEKAVKR